MASTEELTSKYSSQLSQLKAIFPSWDAENLAFTLQDTKGNVDEAAMMITEGRASTFTQATTRKKPVKGSEKPSGRTHSNRNADSGGWEAVNGEVEGGRTGRGGRGAARGARGGRGGRGGETFRGGARGGRGGRGRGAYAGANGTSANGHKNGDYPTTTATDPAEWASQVEQATAAEAAEEAAETQAPKEDAPVPEPSQGDDFASAGGWGDAPSKKELDIAAKKGGTGWQAEIKKPVPAPPANPALKPKMTWAQIAKPQEKPKPTPPPAPVAKPAPPPVTADEPVAEKAAAEPEPAKVEAPVEEAEPVAEEEPEVVEELLPEEPVPEPAAEDDSWATDPAIAGSGAQGAWSKPPQPAAPLAPEPATTYTGPPGFNTVASKTQAAAQPRTSSRSAQRYKTADDQGVVLPPAMTQTMSSMEMQFGSLSFGGLNGDGADAPEPKADTPAAAPPALPAVTSPVRAPVAPPAVAAPPSQPAPTSQPAVAAPAAPAAAAAAQPAQTYASPHQTLQQQMHAYQAHQNQWQQQQAQQQQQQQAASQQQSQQSHQQEHQTSQAYGQQGQYRGAHDYYSGQTAAGQNEQQHAGANNASPYDQSFGAFGGSHGFGGQQGQGYQANDYSRGGYDSHANYGRPPAEDKSAATAQTHTPSNPAQPQIPHQQSQYYNQMGYYPSGPYNPYYQYGQAPQPGGFQQYYPLAQQQRNPYGQPQPPAPAPIPGSKQSAPSAQSPYGSAAGYGSTTSTFEDSGYSSLGGRFDSRTPNQQSSGTSYPSSYSSQHGIHNVIGGAGNASGAARQQAGTPDEAFKSGAGAAAQTAAGRGQGQGAPAQQGQGGQQQQQQQAGNNPAFGGYGGYGGYGNQDWSQYGYAGARGGQSYGGWQQ